MLHRIGAGDPAMTGDFNEGRFVRRGAGRPNPIPFRMPMLGRKLVSWALAATMPNARLTAAAVQIAFKAASVDGGSNPELNEVFPAV